MSRHEVLWMLALGWAPVGIATAGPQLPCTQPAGNCQLADQLGHGSGNAIGAASDANPASGLSARGNFVIDAAGVVRSEYRSAAPHDRPAVERLVRILDTI